MPASYTPNRVDSRSFLYKIYSEKPRLDSSNPPNKPPPSVGHGGYCFKVEQEYHNSDGSVNRKFIGYDDNYDIVQKVETYCSAHAKREGSGGGSKARLFFLGSHPKCDGRVEVETR